MNDFNRYRPEEENEPAETTLQLYADRFEYLKPRHTEILAKHAKILSDDAAALEKFLPELPDNAETKFVFEGASILDDALELIIKDSKKARKEISQELAYHIDDIEILLMRYKHLAKPWDAKKQSKLTSDQMELVQGLIKKLEDDLKTVRNMYYDDGEFVPDKVLYQSFARRMLNGHPKARHHLNYFFSDHLNWKWTQPRVDIGHKTAIGLKNTQIPPEIVSMVYAECSLEAAVALRQVSSCWYSGFSQNETCFQHKLLRRNPWMRPEGELKNWATCVLVFVSRIHSGKWELVSGLGRLTQSRGADVEKFVVASELEYGKILPENFNSLDKHSSPCFSKWCEKVHFGNVSYDAKTKEYKQEEMYGCRVIKADRRETVVSFENYTITLPAGVRFDNRPFDAHNPRQPNFELLERTIVVRTIGRVYVVYKRRPHYKKGFFYDSDEGAMEIGQVFVKSLVRYNKDKKNMFYLYNTYKRRFEHLEAPIDTTPLACYNGILWWWVKQRSAAPMMMDLDTPDMIYTRKEYTIHVHHRHSDAGKWQQFTRGHWLARATHNGMSLMDVRERTISEILFPNKETGKMFVGYEGCMFSAYSMSMETINKCYEEGKKVLEERDKENVPLDTK